MSGKERVNEAFEAWRASACRHAVTTDLAILWRSDLQGDPERVRYCWVCGSLRREGDALKPPRWQPTITEEKLRLRAEDRKRRRGVSVKTKGARK